MHDIAPRWSLAEVYPSPASPAFTADVERLKNAINDAENSIDRLSKGVIAGASWLCEILPLYDTCTDLYENLESFAYASYSVDTGNMEAKAAMNTVGSLTVPLSGLAVRFRDALAALPESIDQLITDAPELEDYRGFLEEEHFFQQRQLNPAEERLAADLARSGADAWSRLHGTISSTLSAQWDGTEEKTVTELRALAFHKDRDVRKRAWQLETAAWKRMETPLAFALNGVKGTTVTMNSRRAWSSTLERSVRQNRLTSTALETLIVEMRRSLPLFRRYLRAKASLLGLPRLSFYDIFAPVGESSSRWSFDEAITFIQDKLGAFDGELGSFVLSVRDRKWIDAQPRSGKVGGAYCIEFPIVGENRILANFDGTYDGVSTLAHELGHAWHSELLRDLPASQRHYPMTLAETASIFNETLLFYRTLDEMTEPAEQLYVLEQYLQGATQVIVDILSRFEFESDLMERRAERELSAQELCDLMITAQKNTYGDALEETELHPYMWAVKGHYYNADLAFYNFPYAFGQLFGLSLYDQFEKQPEGFVSRYRGLLRETGRRNAVDVAGSVGFDIESPSFWRQGLDRIAGLVDRFEKAVHSDA